MDVTEGVVVFDLESVVCHVTLMLFSYQLNTEALSKQL